MKFMNFLKGFTVRLSELIGFVTERSDIKTFSVNGCRTFTSSNQERQILSMKPDSKRMKSNRSKTY